MAVSDDIDGQSGCREIEAGGPTAHLSERMDLFEIDGGLVTRVSLPDLDLVVQAEFLRGLYEVDGLVSRISTSRAVMEEVED